MTDPRPVRPTTKSDDEPPTPEEVASQGAQVVLDPASEAAAGARGEAGETLAENTKARNEGLEDMGLDPQDPSGELTDPDQPDTLPSVVDVPYASQTGDTLHCTKGNWVGEPTSYLYEWTVGRVVYPASDVETYAVTAIDAGETATCIVTATNARGSTVAPPSNAVVVAG